MAKKNEYALYDKEDNLMFIGNSVECAGYLGITLQGFYERVSRLKCGIYSGRYKGTIVTL